MSGSLPPIEAVLTPERAQTLYREGVAHFNAGRYFEVHEALEPLYLRTTGSFREGLQGVIQAASAFFHLERGRVRPGIVLLRAAIARLAGNGSQVPGLDGQALVFELKAALAVAEDSGGTVPVAPVLELLATDVVFGQGQPWCLPERHWRLLARGRDGQ